MTTEPTVTHLYLDPDLPVVLDMFDGFGRLLSNLYFNPNSFSAEWVAGPDFDFFMRARRVSDDPAEWELIYTAGCRVEVSQPGPDSLVQPTAVVG